MPTAPARRALLLAASAMALAACTAELAPPGVPLGPPAETADAFVMPDGARLPFRAWLPGGDPWAVVLALHGMNDSRDAWEYPGPDFAQAGIALYAPDQRGFGASATRGLWAGGPGMAADVRAMV
ncbi:MAG: alpha/beta hydrolase, partial [Rhodospirillales bacterium]|nr:alpha/beta hydrolase [Rhodospirillales bacterium]